MAGDEEGYKIGKEQLKNVDRALIEWSIANRSALPIPAFANQGFYYDVI